MRFLFKYPTRSRPTWFKHTLNLWKRNLSGKHDCLFVVTCDNDDMSMNNSEMKKFMDEQENLEYHFGNSTTKIEAVNADISGHDFDILVVVSDDMEPQVNGYDDIIAQQMSRHFPDLDGALHFNDGTHGRETLITLSIIGRKLYDRFGYVYHPSYRGFFCDNEFTDLVRIHSKVLYLPQVIVRHSWRGVMHDELARKNQRDFEIDRQTYHMRRQLGFPNGIKIEKIA